MSRRHFNFLIAAIVASLIFIITGCSGSGGSVDTKKKGELGGSCNADLSCDSGLVCNSSNICEASPDLNKTCTANTDCSYGLVCGSENKCVAPTISGTKWTKLPIYEDASGYKIEYDSTNNILYLLSYSTLYKATDSGSTWEKVKDYYIDKVYQYSLILYNGKAYIMAVDLNLKKLRFISTSDGNEIKTDFPDNISTFLFGKFFVIHETTADSLYMLATLGNNSYVYKISPDFSSISKVMVNGKQVVFSGEFYIFRKIIYAKVSTGLARYYVTPTGAWSASEFPQLPVSTFYSFTSYLNQGYYDLYALNCSRSPSNNDIYLTCSVFIYSSKTNAWSDPEKTFSQKYSNSEYSEGSIETNPFMTAFNGKIYVKLTGGNLIEIDSSGNPSSTAVANFNGTLFNFGSLMLGGKLTGLYKSTDMKEWKPATASLPGIATTFLGTVNSSIFAGTYYDVLKSTDNGTTWSALPMSKQCYGMTYLNGSQDRTCVGYDFLSPQILGMYHPSDNYVGITTDYGTCSVTDTSTNVNCSSFFPGDSTSPVGVSARYVSENIVLSGINWGGIVRMAYNEDGSAQELEQDDFSDIGYVTHIISDGQSYYALANSQIYKSSNGKDPWEPLSGPQALVNSIMFYPISPATAIYAATDEGLYISRDGGATWGTTISNTRICSTIVQGAVVYAVTDGGKLYSFEDPNLGIKSVGGDLLECPNSMVIKGNQVFVGTSSGIYTLTN